MKEIGLTLSAQIASDQPDMTQYQIRISYPRYNPVRAGRGKASVAAISIAVNL